MIKNLNAVKEKPDKSDGIKIMFAQSIKNPTISKVKR